MVVIYRLYTLLCLIHFTQSVFGKYDHCHAELNFSRNNTGDTAIARRPMKATPKKDDGPRINEDIDDNEVQLIDETGQNVGLVPTEDALNRALENNMDLVEINAGSKPPIVKILDYGKYKYQAQKKAAEARKKQKSFDVKEIKLRPNIDTHDYDVKMRNMQRFFDAGDKVKVTLRFRGREMAHQQLGMELLRRVKEQTEEIAKVELEPRLEGRQMIMVLAPR